MILPGISGSFILVMLGMYTEVLGAVNDVTSSCSRTAFMVGCVVVSLFSMLLTGVGSATTAGVLAAMIGLMSVHAGGCAANGTTPPR